MTAEYIQSEQFSHLANIKHGFFTKNGGVSTGIYASLNCGTNSLDAPENVRENRQRVMRALDISKAKLYGLHQIHSTKVYQVNSDMDYNDFPKGDALVTTETNIALSVLGADCTPVLFASDSGVIAAAHAGWQGAASGIIEAVVEKMCQLGAKRESISACIGPTIHQDSYQVRQDFIQQLNKRSQIPVEPFLAEKEGDYSFDLPAYLLEQANVSGISAVSVGLDTYQKMNTPVAHQVPEYQFFSYRRNTHNHIKDYGRQISVICRID